MYIYTYIYTHTHTHTYEYIYVCMIIPPSNTPCRYTHERSRKVSRW